MENAPIRLNQTDIDKLGVEGAVDLVRSGPVTFSFTPDDRPDSEFARAEATEVISDEPAKRYSKSKSSPHPALELTYSRRMTLSASLHEKDVMRRGPVDRPQ